MANYKPNNLSYEELRKLTVPACPGGASQKASLPGPSEIGTFTMDGVERTVIKDNITGEYRLRDDAGNEEPIPDTWREPLLNAGMIE